MSNLYKPLPAVRRSLPVLLALALFSGAAGAAPLKILGLDDMSCRAWVKARDDADQKALYLAWLRGFLSGHNYARPSQQVSEISSGTVAQFVDRYCSEKPLGSVSEAVQRLSDQFSGRNEAISK